ncbi:MAG: DedA family protein [Chloroflexi bacterium]|nr:DedA family protein [Chloroflexota bacterium]
MALLMEFIGFFLHLDTQLQAFIDSYGTGTYLLLFAVVFCETGLVVTPFLPGDSLLFAAGTFAAKGSLSVGLLFVLLVLAVALGDNVNYWIGRTIGPRIFRKETSRLFKREYLDRTHRFYEKHGGKAVVLARFVPIVRTFAPFVAGIGRMPYGRFLGYSVGGSLSWITIFLLGGYRFGKIPAVERNFTLVIIAVIAVSVMPAVFAFLRQCLRPAE